jgi:hypothetical protein
MAFQIFGSKYYKTTVMTQHFSSPASFMLDCDALLGVVATKNMHRDWNYFHLLNCHTLSDTLCYKRLVNMVACHIVEMLHEHKCALCNCT